MCNLKYKYEPPVPPAPAELEGRFFLLLIQSIPNRVNCNRKFNSIFTSEVVIPAPPSDKPNENFIIVIVACCAGVIVLASIVVFFFYRNRKTAMFNEVPTVKTIKRRSAGRTLTNRMSNLL